MWGNKVEYNDIPSMVQRLPENGLYALFFLNIIYDYNNGMNDVDLAYQVWNVYKWGFSCITRIGGNWLWCGI